MSTSLSKEKEAEIIRSMMRFFAEKLEVALTELQAKSLLAYFFDEIGPIAYNQRVEDTQKQLIRLAEDLPGTCFKEPLIYWETNAGSRVRRKPQT